MIINAADNIYVVLMCWVHLCVSYMLIHLILTTILHTVTYLILEMSRFSSVTLVTYLRSLSDK